MTNPTARLLMPLAAELAADQNASSSTQASGTVPLASGTPNVASSTPAVAAPRPPAPAPAPAPAPTPSEAFGGALKDRANQRNKTAEQLLNEQK
ncbi:hypothetical protein [Ideonella sp.]|jgi:hypothetical protein|uniref:hypothetical protein n=1 Tax=Ideonella sp. TaxID=1929293 RepID=UPI0037BF9103